MADACDPHHPHVLKSVKHQNNTSINGSQRVAHRSPIDAVGKSLNPQFGSYGGYVSILPNIVITNLSSARTVSPGYGMSTFVASAVCWIALTPFWVHHCFSSILHKSYLPSAPTRYSL